jgi:flagellar protein FlaI
VKHIWEVEDYEKYREIVRWNPVTDKHEVVSESYHLRVLGEKLGKTYQELLSEIERRKVVLEWLKAKGIKETADVFKAINRYYMYPDEVYAQASEELKELGVKITPVKVKPRVTVEVAPLPAITPKAVVEVARTSPEPLGLTPQPQGGLGTPAAGGIEVPVDLSADARLVLRSLLTLGGEADHNSLLSLTPIPRERLSKAIGELSSKRLIVPTLLYVDNRPMLGYKLTSDGQEIAKKLGLSQVSS